MAGQEFDFRLAEVYASSRERPADPIVLELEGGMRLTLQYNMRTLREIKTEFNGLSFSRGTGLDTVDEDCLPKIIWYGAREAHPEVTVEHIEVALTGRLMPYAMRTVQHAATGVDSVDLARKLKNAVASEPTQKTNGLPTS